MTYFFHLFSDAPPVLDSEGREFADHAGIVRHAEACARDIIAEDARHGVIDLHQRIAVFDHVGSSVHILRFEDAVAIRAAA
jgi:hypothetical protein